MSTLAELTKDDQLRQLAPPATIRYGNEIFRAGDVVFSAVTSQTAAAKVSMSGMLTRHTKLVVHQAKLTWSCTCTQNPKNFCKHVVATALALQKDSHADIYKAAAVIIQDRKLLCTRSVGKPAFITPGGRLEPGETAEQALARELKEEVSITVRPLDLQPFGNFSAEAANHPGQQVHMQVFMVRQWQGSIAPAAEIEEVRWFTANLPTDVEIGSIFAHEVIPRLKAQNLID